MHSCEHAPEKEQNFKGTCADKQVRLDKLKKAQKAKAKVTCEGEELKNAFNFKYLGSIFSADGTHVHDVK